MSSQSGCVSACAAISSRMSAGVRDGFQSQVSVARLASRTTHGKSKGVPRGYEVTVCSRVARGTTR